MVEYKSVLLEKEIKKKLEDIRYNHRLKSLSSAVTFLLRNIKKNAK